MIHCIDIAATTTLVAAAICDIVRTRSCVRVRPLATRRHWGSTRKGPKQATELARFRVLSQSCLIASSSCPAVPYLWGVAFHIVWLPKLCVQDVVRGASAAIIPVIKNWALKSIREQVYPGREAQTGWKAEDSGLCHLCWNLAEVRRRHQLL